MDSIFHVTGKQTSPLATSLQNPLFHFFELAFCLFDDDLQHGSSHSARVAPKLLHSLDSCFHLLYEIENSIEALFVFEHAGWGGSLQVCGSAVHAESADRFVFLVPGVPPWLPVRCRCERIPLGNCRSNPKSLRHCLMAQTTGPESHPFHLASVRGRLLLCNLITIMRQQASARIFEITASLSSTLISERTNCLAPLSSKKSNLSGFCPSFVFAKFRHARLGDISN